MLAQELIRIKRDGGTLSSPQIRELVAGIANGQLGDEQLGALAMAIFIHSMNEAERVALTLAMRDSGHLMRWNDLPLRGPVLDKHSTGGVGDGTSLLIGPWLAACGAHIPMISGRGLGHTGGTLDKLSSIPGFNPFPEPERFRRQVAELGVAIIGQTDDLAPADRRFYAVRDVTATVESLPLIVASILSKKLAEGLDGLVLDVKLGSGAVMTDPDRARSLATAIAATAGQAGTPTTAVLSDMSQALAANAGNALEVLEIIDILKGNLPGGRLLALSRELAAEMLLVGHLASDIDQAYNQLDQVWNSGQVADCFARMIRAQGGPADLLEAPNRHLDRAPHVTELLPDQAGIVQSVNVRELGLAVVELGGGRRRASDSIDPAVGLEAIAGPGQAVDRHRALLKIHARKLADADKISAALRRAFVIGPHPAKPQALVAERLRPRT
jgi:thymidine phosphorylase